ncbi:MAG: hypothetical protein ACXWUG_08870 [Polyangiales bacterium]
MDSHERFKTSWAYVVLFGFLSLTGFGLGAFLLAIDPNAWVGWVMLTSGIVLLGLTIVEASVPALELEGDTLVVRVARLRKPTRIPLREAAPFSIERNILGLVLRRDDGGPITIPGAGELVSADSRAMQIPCRQLPGRERDRLEQLLLGVSRRSR